MSSFIRKSSIMACHQCLLKHNDGRKKQINGEGWRENQGWVGQKQTVGADSSGMRWTSEKIPKVAKSHPQKSPLTPSNPRFKIKPIWLLQLLHIPPSA